MSPVRTDTVRQALLADLDKLRDPQGYLRAGWPRYHTLFGRDSLISAWQTLRVDSSIARSTLQVLASYQGRRVDPVAEEEPGKILHEHRFDSASRAELPSWVFPYYGSVDSTPLFLVVAGAESRGVADDVESWRGLSRRMPFMAFSMTILLLSLAGIPPLGGFFSKFILFSSAVSAMRYNPWYLALAVSGVLNSALSLYYYARVIWYMYILEPEAGASHMQAPRSISASVLVSVGVVILASFVMFFLVDYLTRAAVVFFS